MADLSITAANVLPGGGATTTTGTAGAAITAGQPVYKDGSGNLNPALCDTTLHAAAIGIAANNAAANQPAAYYPTGVAVSLGSVMTAGQTYVVSVNSGKIAPISDLTTGNYVTILGVAQTTSILFLSINATAVAHA